MMTELMLVEGVSDVQLISYYYKMCMAGDMKRIIILEYIHWMNMIT